MVIRCSTTSLALALSFILKALPSFLEEGNSIKYFYATDTAEWLCIHFLLFMIS